ncbi:MAG: copper homeostasis protein CutC [Oscillospiraceae bacterium]
MKQVILEVCCGSADDAIEAWKAGAKRVELNSDLFHGGLTPTVGELIVTKRETGLKVLTMVRPREGGFCYTEGEFQTGLEDAKQLLEHGADGLVFGFLHEDGTLDKERTRCLAQLAQAAGKETVFHRAIDVVANWREVLDVLIELGITRVLTSGQEPNVLFGTATVREMIAYAAGRIQILPGAGITAKNMDRVIAETGCDQMHLAAHKTRLDPSVNNNNEIFYGGALYPPEDRYNVTDRAYISGIVDRLPK